MSLKKVMAILPNMLQLASATLKTNLYLPCEVVHDPDTFLLGDSPNGDSLELWDGLRTVLVNIVFQEPPQIKIWGLQIWGMGGPLDSASSTDQSVGKAICQ